VGPRGPEAGGYSEVTSRFDADWLRKIETQYDLWKKGEDMDVEGTPIKNWPAIPPGLMKTCLDLHILSVEQLAACADDVAERLGMGGISWRQRARDWLAASAGDGGKLSARLSAAEAENTNKDVLIKSMQEQMATMQAELAKLTQKKAA